MPSDMGRLFGKDYYAHNCGLPYERNEHWLTFFSGIAKRISQDICPKTVLDAGCAKGFLVEGLREFNIEAFGVDISEYAIGSVHESIKDYCRVGSLTTKLTKHYDLIVCIEVLEHMNKEDSEKSVEVLCEASNDILFSSSPFDYKESTHFNVQPPEYWAELFAKHGFSRDVDFDASFITPWTIRFKRENKPTHRVIREFERKFWLLWQENHAVREELCRFEKDRSDQAEKLVQAELFSGKRISTLEKRLSILESENARLINHINWVQGSNFWKARSVLFPIKQRIEKSYRTLTNSLKKNSLYALNKESRIAEPPEYEKWIKSFEPDLHTLTHQVAESSKLNYRPTISVLLPVYKVPIRVLRETISSILEQTYPFWEICIAFADHQNTEARDYLVSLSQSDERFKVICLSENLGISENSNVCLKQADGEFVALLDHDDLLSPFAFYEFACALNKDENIDFLYSDKDCITEDSSTRMRLLLKPSWSPEMMYSANYLTHLCVIRRTLVQEVGGFRKETDGAQDWDLFFRVTEKTQNIERVPGVLYHWRTIKGSTSMGIEAKPYAERSQLLCIREHLQRIGIDASASLNEDSGFHIYWPNKSTIPISILVDGCLPDADLCVCLTELAKSIILRSNTNISVLVFEKDYEETIKKCQEIPCISDIWQYIRWIFLEENFEKGSAFLDFAKSSHTDTIAFLSGRLVGFSSDWISESVQWVANHPDIGFTSSLVLTNENKVVEAGLILDNYGQSAPLFQGRNLFDWDTFGGSLWYRNCSASSPWAISFSKKKLLRSGCLDEAFQPNMENIITHMCQRLVQQGYRGLVNPHSRVFLETVPEPVLRLDASRQGSSFNGDPFFHPAFSSVVPLRLNQ